MKQFAYFVIFKHSAKRLNLTIFFVVLTLSIGLTSINLQSSPDNAFALDNKINDAIWIACSSYDDESNGLKDKITNVMESCLKELSPPSSPPPIREKSFTFTSKLGVEPLSN